MWASGRCDDARQSRTILVDGVAESSRPTSCLLDASEGEETLLVVSLQKLCKSVWQLKHREVTFACSI